MTKRPDRRSYRFPDREDSEMRAEVLVEYDGPRVVLYRSKDVDRLGIVIDAGADPETWVLARVSQMELEMLALGSLPVRDVFSHKETLQALQLDVHGKTLATRDIEIGEVPPGALPIRAAPLPETSRPRLLKLLRLKDELPVARRVRFGGRPVREERIEFSALARLMQTLQELWRAIGDKLGLFSISEFDDLPTTALLAGATEGGSFVVNVHAASNEVFDKVLGDYEHIMRLAFDDPEKAAEAVASHADLRKGLNTYLQTLEELHAEATIEAPGARVYIGGGSAKAVRAAMRAPALARQLAEPEEEESSTQVRGYFRAFDMDRATYAFHDIDTGQTLTGSIGRPLTKKIRDEGAKEATVGTRTRYVATVKQLRKETTLVDFAKSQGDLFD